VRVGIVSDLHCNQHGLLRALDIMGDVDELICLGDSVYEYRFSNEVIEILRDRAAHTILGNHEEGFLGPQGVRARAADWIDPALLGWLADRPPRLMVEIGGKKLLLVHSTRGSRAGLMSTRTARSSSGSPRPTPISCSTATPTTSSSAGSAGCW